MTKHTITATFSDGTTKTRRSAHAYTHAVKHYVGVSFHKTEKAAREAAGSTGEVVRTDIAEAAVKVAPPSAAEIAKAEARAAVRRIRREHGVRSDEYRAAEADYFARYGRPE